MSILNPDAHRETPPSRVARCLLALALIAVAPVAAPSDEPGPSGAEGRAVAFLVREVPRWSRTNHCFSCHNNGDGARALLSIRDAGLAPPREALAETLAFLEDPASWPKNGPDAEFNDLRLARLQFASTLTTAIESGKSSSRAALILAAALLAKDQAADGSWPIDDVAPTGSPATYGPPLATATAIRILREADPKQFGKAIARAEAWIRRRPIVNLSDAASVLFVLDRDRPGDRERIGQARDYLARNQNGDGGWGPFARSASEPFDTALALLAVARGDRDEDTRTAIRCGRDFLARVQLGDGSWKETTRPSGGESYAQRISTTAWATMALLATRPSRANAPRP